MAKVVRCGRKDRMISIRVNGDVHEWMRRGGLSATKIFDGAVGTLQSGDPSCLQLAIGKSRLLKTGLFNTPQPKVVLPGYRRMRR